ncbi:MAG: hypothetical protein KME55_35815 [Nostoc indistinguendum CM1-VF10]|jgi:hypothetical protein|nr:hypothetical protein [Nostoc indistinguendum CM1-VF10]
MLSSIFEQFVKESPVSVMMRALMSHIFATERMDRLFTKHAQVQYQQDLLFSSQVDLMSLVVCGVQKSIHAAYKARAENLSLFQTVTKNFHGEIPTLAYPKAALFSFSMALVSYNILATLRAALGGVHGVEKIEAGLSDFYLVDELQGTYRGMMIAIPALEWEVFQTISRQKMAQLLQELSTGVNLKQFLKAIRGVKKPKVPMIYDSKQGHVSTTRLLEQYNHS